MYATPALRPLDLLVAEASCCRILVDEAFAISTGLCPFPTCGGTTTQPVVPCTVTLGPVTVSGT